MSFRQNTPTGNSSQGNWLKLADAARSLDVSEITLRRRIKSGQVPCEFKNGKYYVYISEDEDDFPELPPMRESPRQNRPHSSAPMHRQPQIKESPRNLRSRPNVQFDEEQESFDRPLGHDNTLGRRQYSAPQNYSQNYQQNEPIDRSSRPILNSATDDSVHSEIQQLRRALEDQQSLISMLEEAVESLQRQFSARTKFQ